MKKILVFMLFVVLLSSACFAKNNNIAKLSPLECGSGWFSYKIERVIDKQAGVICYCATG